LFYIYCDEKSILILIIALFLACVKTKYYDKLAPLYVLDGIVVSIINTISPASIASISVIKDEKAIAKYGQKGKHGVIEITTKDE
jgi:TonB-dependent SusC/RagA subfamily outer membrane receptor